MSVENDQRLAGLSRKGRGSLFEAGNLPDKLVGDDVWVPLGVEMTKLEPISGRGGAFQCSVS